MRCPRCGVQSPDGFRFCGACGSRLQAPDGAPHEEERKTISALFCDLVGFTPRAEQLDPEDVHRLLAAYYARVRSEFERFGGTVAKFIGDAVFVLFGVPRAHEDDPERAVRAALAGLDAVADLNEAHPDLDLHVHIGVTTGEAFVTLGPRAEEEGLAWGDILNTASRIEGAAAPDTILVDDRTYRATRHAIDYEAVPPVNAKGITEPVVVWRPLAPVARRGLDLAAGASHHAIVGRNAELGMLLETLDRADTARTPQLVTLVGDPGIGKSRLIVELFGVLEARPGLITWRHGRSPPYPKGVSYWALGEIVKGQAGLLETDGAAAAAGKLERAVRDLMPSPADAARIESHLRSLVGLAEAADTRGDQRGAAFAAWRHFLEALARQRPLVLVLEDVHWADDGLLDFIEDLLEWSHDVPLLIICTARPELLERRPEWGASPRARTLALAPLSDDDTRALVMSLAGDAGVPDDVAHAIVDNAAGNPLYSVEFVRMLAGRGLLGAPGPVPVPPGGAGLPLPESLRGIIASRIDALAIDEKQLLQAASVVGRVVWPGVLSAISGRPAQWVGAHLEALEAREFLARTPRSSVEHEPEYRFQHVLIRDVAYGQIPRRRKGEIHRHTAEWLETLSPDRAVDRAEMLAHHYLCAYDLSRAVGADGGPLAERARLALRDAGDRVLGLHAFPAAAGYFRSALDLWPQDDEERPSLLLRLGKSLYFAETAGAEVLSQASAGLIAAGDRGAAAEAEGFLAYLAHHRGRRDRFSEHLDRAVALVEGLGPTRSKAEVLVDLATYRSIATDHDRTVAAASEALEIAHALGLRELEARALSIIGISRGLSGDLAGREDLERSIAIAEDIGSHQIADSCGKLADLEAQVGNLARCFSLQARARVHAERFGHAPFVRWLAAERVGEGYWSGAWDEALDRAEAVIAEVENGKPNFMEGYCRAMRGRIRLARGDEAAALEDAGRALAFARAAEDLQMLYPALAFAARAEVAVGSRDAGERLADELLELWRSRLDAYPASAWLVDFAVAMVALGRAADIAVTADEVRTPTRWLQAVVAFVSDRFQQAAERFGDMGSLPDEAVARLRATEALLDEGDELGARAQLDRARTFLVRVGADAYLAEAAELARALVVAPVRRP